MSQANHLGWPFFEEEHRSLARALEAWLEGGGLGPGGRSAGGGGSGGREGGDGNGGRGGGGGSGLGEEEPRGAALDDACRELVRRLGAGGWLRYLVPRRYGGAFDHLDVRAICLLREALAARDGLADFAFALQGLGSAPISLFGSEELRRDYLPRVAGGAAIAAFALSEAEAGSDVAAMRTVARRADDGWVLDGEKSWISNAGIADHYVVFCRMPEGGEKSFGAFLVEAGNGGFSVSGRVEAMAPHPLGTLVFDGCRVPAGALVGEPGQGLKVALATLDLFRPTVGAAALGFARRALEEAVAHARGRRVFGQAVADHQLTRGKLADMATAVDASALLVYRAAWARDSGAPRISREAAMAKLYATEAAQRVVDEAVQILGGRGVVRGETVERLYREVRALRIYEGTSEIQRLIIAGQLLAGAPRTSAAPRAAAPEAAAKAAAPQTAATGAAPEAAAPAGAAEPTAAAAIAAPGAPSGHVDRFCRDALPPRELWPVMSFGGVPELAAYPPRLNCAAELLDARVARGDGERIALRAPVPGRDPAHAIAGWDPAHAIAGWDRAAATEGREALPEERWSYRRLLACANRIAGVLVEDLGLVPGNRVLLRGPNTPMLAACWLAVLKAGGVVVATMPLLRVRELVYIADKARIQLALTDRRIAADCEQAMRATAAGAPRQGARVVCFGGAGDARERGEGGDGGEAGRAEGAGAPSLEALMRGKPESFANCDTAADDAAIIAFTSGTTGQAKGTMHFHRDILAATDCFPRYVLRPEPDDVFCGSPPLAFTYGLGGLLLFPLRFGASTLLLEQATPPHLLQGIQDHRATICFTAPTAYRAMCPFLGSYDISSLRKCVSAGETLPLATFEAWRRATGLRIIDGIGTTEMLHMFISSAGDEIRPGATGRVVPGYETKLVDESGDDLPPGVIGRLAVRGPTGCRYLDDVERQKGYVQRGWNLTGDSYLMDEDGYFWYQARTDDMIVSAGYNISGPEVEAVLLEHPKVRECGVVGIPDAERGQLVTAFVVLAEDALPGEATVKELQEFVKAAIAPYKYPRRIEFVEALPRTETGKLQRFRLRQGGR